MSVYDEYEDWYPEYEDEDDEWESWEDYDYYDEDDYLMYGDEYEDDEPLGNYYEEDAVNG